MDRDSNPKGTYILIIELNDEGKIVVGSLGEITFGRGIYAYVGSAMGPGGIVGRVLRHLRRSKKKFWHIDYLLDRARIIMIIVLKSEERLECKIAEEMRRHRMEYIPRFGSSDCRCPSHLFKLRSIDNLLLLLKNLDIGYVEYNPEEFVQTYS